MPFFTVLSKVLAGVVEISELPPNRMVAFDNGNSIGKHEVPLEVILMLVRLQTMIVLENEDTYLSDNPGTAEEMTNALCIREDSLYRINMLRRLMVEIVREAVPKEADRFNVNYFVTLDKQITWCRASQKMSTM